MASEDIHPLVIDRPLSRSASEASAEDLTTSIEMAMATESPSRSSFALLVNGKQGIVDSDDMPPSDPEDSLAVQKSIRPSIIDRLHLDLVRLPETTPNGCFASVSYAADMEQFANRNHTANAFVDPFEEEERRSRTEMWVESTSPGYASDDDPKKASVAESDESVPMPEVKVSACSEKSASASPPGNTTTSTTGGDEELPTSVQIQINDEVFSNSSKPKGEMDRMDSLATSEKSDANSLVSSDLDKASLVKFRFNCNLHQAREDAKKEVDMENFDRFWRHLYNKSEPSKSEESKKKEREEKQEERKTTRRRARTPTPSIERVVLYYTTDRRISLTPTASSISPSPEPNSQRSFTFDSGRHLFIQTNKPSMTSQDSVSSEPLGDKVSPVVAQKSPLGRQGSTLSEPTLGNSVAQTTLRRLPLTEQDSMSSEPIGDIVIPVANRPPSGSKRVRCKAFGRGIVIEESEETSSDKIEEAILDSKEETETFVSNGDMENGVDSPSEGNIFFKLDELSGSESEEGRVDVNHAYEMKLSTSLTPEKRLIDQSTSTADLSDVICRQGRSDGANAYKREQSDKSTVTTPLMDDKEQSTIKEMQDQATSTSGSPPPPAVVLEDAPETESSIPDFKEQLSDIDTSSLEDLLAMDTRPNSSNRKSVSFSDFIDVEIVSPEPQKKSPSPEFRNFTVKPILKKDLKQTESMRRLLDYAAERLYKDLLMLVEERDRSIHALELTPEEDDHALSTQTCIFQKRYRDRLLENKLTLDKRIDQVWQKLKDMAVDGQIGQFVYGVRHSSELTLNVKRRVNLRRESLPLPRKTRSDIEMVCDLSRRLSLVREQLKHKDPLEESSLSMENMLSAVSRIINGSNGKATC
ncbi:hypothetical protein V3C99_010068 [Haemonchus contortus]